MTNLRMMLLENGLDELDAAVDALRGTPTPRNLKRAVTDLASGVELVLKERLRQIDWRLIFDDVAIADKQALTTGDFYSPKPDEVIRRLCANGLRITQGPKRRFARLRKQRNVIEHYAFIDTIDAVRASTSATLSAILDFIVEHLDVPSFTDNERTLYDSLHKAVNELDEYVTKRLADIRPAVLKAEADGTVVECPACEQSALALGGGHTTCLFCRHRGEPESVADHYIRDVLGLSEHETVTAGGTWPRACCPSCSRETLVQSDDVATCFACGGSWTQARLDECLRCGSPFEVDGELTVCPGCYSLATTGAP